MNMFKMDSVIEKIPKEISLDGDKSLVAKVFAKDTVIEKTAKNFPNAVSDWLGMKSTEDISLTGRNIRETLRPMVGSLEQISASLADVNRWKINPSDFDRQLNQHAGTVAEIISTYKDNLYADIKRTGETVFRTADLPEFPTYDQYVDKVVKNARGEIIERIQMKFVGKDGADTLSELLSPKFDKYFSDGMVDKIEIARDRYDEIMDGKLIQSKSADLKAQLGSATEPLKSDINSKLNKLQRLENGMLKRSRVSTEEARYAVLHPRRIVSKLFAEDVILRGHDIGKKTGLGAATVTAAVSTVKNVRKFVGGEQSAMDAANNIAKDTGLAGLTGYGVGFVSSAVARAMSASSYRLVQSLAKTSLPVAAVSFAVDSYASVRDYATGEINGIELAKELGESAVSIAGGVAGTALAGAALGSVIPGVGNVAGFAVGLAGGLVGTAVASEAYRTAVELGSSMEAEKLLEQVKDAANSAIDFAKKYDVAIAAGTVAGIATTAVTEGIGASTGATVGGAVGAAVGTFVMPGVGTLVGLGTGADVGSVVGAVAAPVVAGVVTGVAFDACRQYFAENNIPLAFV